LTTVAVKSVPTGKYDKLLSVEYRLMDGETLSGHSSTPRYAARTARTRKSQKEFTKVRQKRLRDILSPKIHGAHTILPRYSVRAGD